MGVATEGPASLLRIGDTAIGERVGPPKEDIRIRASSYYMNNREIFVDLSRGAPQNVVTPSCTVSRTRKIVIFA